jgi:CheY-like chemotaxis protein
MNKYTILWADDDPDDLELFEGVLEELTSEYEVVEFKNGMELLDHLSTRNSSSLPSLIILDINMPVYGGKETLVILKTDPLFKDIPVVVLSTSNNPLDRAFFKKYGTEMFTKPPSVEEIRQVIQQMLTYIRRA